MQELEGMRTKVGWFDTARYEDGTAVAYVATIQEFGAPTQAIPARPFMRPTIIERQAEWKALMSSGSKAIAKGKRTALEVMTILGLQAEGDVRLTISTLTEPALSPLTIAVRAYMKEQGTPLGKLKGRRELGKVAKLLEQNKIDVSGVSTKPLVFSSLMLATLTSVVEKT